MNLSNEFKVLVLTALMAVVGSGQVEARKHHHCRDRGRPPRVVVRERPSRPFISVMIGNDFYRQERLSLALAYLADHKHLSVKQYAKITGQNKKMAEVELNAFVMNKNIPIGVVFKGKKKFYVKTR